MFNRKTHVIFIWHCKTVDAVILLHCFRKLALVFANYLFRKMI
jgi:hypothetical protein